MIGTAEDSLPRRAAIERTVDAALGIRLIDVAHGGDEEAIGIRRVDGDTADLAGGVEPDVAPRLARVGGFVHAVAVGVLAADIDLAGADVHNVGVGWRHFHGAYGADRNALVGDGAPGVAGVFGLPNAAAHRAEVEGVGLAGVAGDAVSAAAAHGTYVAPFETGEQAIGILIDGSGLLGEDDGEQTEGSEREIPMAARYERHSFSSLHEVGWGAPADRLPSV